MEPLNVGLWSGLFYPSKGHRRGLGKAAKRIFLREKIGFSVYVGGLIDKETLTKKLDLLIRLTFRELVRVEKMKPEKERRSDEQVKEGIRGGFYDKIASDLVEHFPVLGVKTYLITSPGYEGEMGKQIGRRLAEKRSDIYHYHGHKLLPLQGDLEGKYLGVYTDEVGPTFRSKYYDAPILRVLEDQKQASENRLGDFDIVGPFGSSVFNPGAAREVKRPYVSVPMLSKPRRVRTSENQFGVRILEIRSTNLKESLVATYSFKDLVSKEGSLTHAPFRATEVQKAIVSVIGQSGSKTIGQLEEELHKKREMIALKREVIAKEASALCAKPASNKWPGLHFDEAQKEYGFEKKWFQERLRYPLLKAGELFEESFLVFGCLHAMCKWSDMLWFRDQMAKYCIEHNVQYFVGVGDFIEGLKHDLVNVGEVQSQPSGPSNYTYQERVAAYLVAMPMLEVFDYRIKEFLQNVRGREKKVEQEELLREVKKALLNFIFRPGNHCGWTKPLGFDSLGTFTPALRTFLGDGVGERLSKAGLTLDSEVLRNLVKDKTVNITKTDDQSYLLPSGLRVNLYHPEMGGTLTPSIRPQQALAFSPNQIVFNANFHSGEGLEEWAYALGQRVCLQVGTLKKKSSFEEGKQKIVDFGVGLLKVFSDPNSDPNFDSKKKRIFKTEIAFFGIPKSDKDLEADNARFVQEYEAFWQKYR